MHPTRVYFWFPLALLWFGASISVAEIHTGGLIASAGITPGLVAIAAGHLVGVVLLGLMGYVGFREGMPSIMCTRIAFGKRGSWLLSLANVLQLLGWTAVMLQQNAQAVSGITRSLWGVEAGPVVTVFMGCLVLLWALWESDGKTMGNSLAVLLLGLLAVLVSWTLWGRAEGVTIVAPAKPMPFSEAFELALIMPLSWVPLVADYACRAKSARAACLAPALGYLAGSVWMYCLGFAGALITGEADPTPMLLAAGLGVAALSVVVLSTVVTTFLDVYSVVASARNVMPTLPVKTTSCIAVFLGTCAALVWDSNVYINFLSCIGAVFAPLSAILFTDYFLLRVDAREQAMSLPSIVSLGAGIAAHVLFSAFGSPLGPTFSCLLVALLVQVAGRTLKKRMQWGQLISAAFPVVTSSDRGQKLHEEQNE